MGVMDTDGRNAWEWCCDASRAISLVSFRERYMHAIELVHSMFEAAGRNLILSRLQAGESGRLRFSARASATADS
jgi:hypothetical protein